MKLQKWLPFRFDRPEGTNKPATAEREHPLAVFQSEMNRLFTRFWKEPFADLGSLESWFGDHRPAFFRPVVDVIDEAKTLKVVVELPGVEEKDVEVAVEDGMLVIRGEKQLEKETEERGVFRIERSFGKFERSIPLPHEVATEEIHASFKKGVLTVEIPKQEEVKSDKQRVPIHA